MLQSSISLEFPTKLGTPYFVMTGLTQEERASAGPCVGHFIKSSNQPEASSSEFRHWPIIAEVTILFECFDERFSHAVALGTASRSKFRVYDEKGNKE